MTTLDFWDDRARQHGTASTAGSDDVVLKELEVTRIAREVQDGMGVLDAGCGNGWTVLHLASHFTLRRLEGWDASREMLRAAAQAMAEQAVQGHLKSAPDWWRRDVCQPLHAGLFAAYDLVYTERLLINLPSWEAQRAALVSLSRLVAPGGTLLVVESCADGTAALNTLRAHVGLPAIVPPPRCRYLSADAMWWLELPGFSDVEEDDFTSTYYLLSRVVNAHLAHGAGEEPAYDAPVNRLALSLPGTLCSGYGQTRAWTWRRHR